MNESEQICGMTSLELIKHLRIKKGRELLEDSCKTLEQIAEACGFHDAAYFSRMFKQSLLMTPGQYRKRMRLSKKIEFI